MANKTPTSTTDIATTAGAADEKSIATRDEAMYIVPPVDIYETENGLTVVTDLPGVAKDGVEIKVEDNVLTIKGKTAYTPPENAIRREFNLVDFYRQFQLNDEVDQEKISAESKNGVLTITLPKAEKSKPRQINVKVG